MILIGRNDADALAGGWHPLQDGPAGVPCRWMSPQATVRIPPPQANTHGISVTVSAPALIRGQRPGLSIYKGKELLGHCADLGPEGAWNAAFIFFDESPDTAVSNATDLVALTFAVENRDNGEATPLSFVPHEVLSNGDLRELGVQVSSIRWIAR